MLNSKPPVALLDALGAAEVVARRPGQGWRAGDYSPPSQSSTQRSSRPASAADSKAPLADRVTAIRLVGRGPGDTAVGSRRNSPSCSARSRRLKSSRPPLRRWRGRMRRILRRSCSSRGKDTVPPSVPRSCRRLLGRESSVASVLHALEKKEILPADVDAAARQRLLAHTKPRPFATGPASCWPGGSTRTGQKVIEAYRAALTKAGDRERGKQVFVRACAACHKVGDVGKGLGPDLVGAAGQIGRLPARQPARSKPGGGGPVRRLHGRTERRRTRVGFLSAETATSITLVATDGQEHTILRADLELADQVRQVRHARGSGEGCLGRADGRSADVSAGRHCRRRRRRHLPGTSRRSFVPAPMVRSIYLQRPPKYTDRR